MLDDPLSLVYTKNKRAGSPLLYDPAIYWLQPYIYAEQMVSLSVLRTERGRIWAYGHASESLNRGIVEAAREAGWLWYTPVDQPDHDDPHSNIRTLWRHVYEQVGFTYIRQIAAPLGIDTLRIKPQGGMPVDLELRSLMYRGERVRGALRGTELYVVFPSP